MGKRLRENISDENSFILKNERCPFLNDDNLCDIIINCGESGLCQICRDHPRFFNWYGDIKEGGIGLSCQEGARLILTTDSVSFDESEVCEEPESVDEELFKLLYFAREEMFGIIDSEDKTLCQCLCECLDFAHRLQFFVDNPHLSQADFSLSESPVQCDTVNEMLRMFGETEPIDESWTKQYESLLEFTFMGEVSFDIVSQRYLKNIFRYFIYRYFLDGVFYEEILSRVKFAAVSVIVIALMTGGKNDIETWIEKSKLYSKQMEYSDENRALFYDKSYEMECFDCSAIKEVIKKMF